MNAKNGASILETIITGADLAGLTGHSERTIKRLTVQRIVKLAHDSKGRTLKNRYVAGDACPRVCEYLRDQALVDDPNEVVYRSARARKMEALATSEEMRVKLQQGELIERAFVEREVMNVLTMVKNHMLSIPSRLMYSLVGKTDPREINLLVRGEVRAALTEASEFDAEKIVSGKFKNADD